MTLLPAVADFSRANDRTLLQLVLRAGEDGISGDLLTATATNDLGRWSSPKCLASALTRLGAGHSPPPHAPWGRRKGGGLAVQALYRHTPAAAHTRAWVSVSYANSAPFKSADTLQAHLLWNAPPR